MLIQSLRNVHTNRLGRCCAGLRLPAEASHCVGRRRSRRKLANRPHTLLTRKSYNAVRPKLKSTKAAGCCLDNFSTVNDAVSVSSATDDALFAAEVVAARGHAAACLAPASKGERGEGGAAEDSHTAPRSFRGNGTQGRRLATA